MALIRGSIVLWIIAALLTACLVFVAIGWVELPPGSTRDSSTPETISANVKERSCNASSVDGVTTRCYLVKTEDQVSLSLAVMTSQDQRSSSDGLAEPASIPLVYLPGGPGTQGNSDGEMLSYWQDWYANAQIGRPFIVVDYRYLAPSKPNYQCLSYQQTVRRLLKLNLSMSEEGAFLHTAFQSCLAQAEKSLGTSISGQSSVARVNTPTNAADVQQAMKNLGFSAWHLLGVSYGTRVALYAAMTQPEVQKVILDSPYVFSSGGESQSASLWPHAFRAFFERCQQFDACRAVGVSEQQLFEAFKFLGDNPLSIHSENWQTGVMETWLLNDVRFASFLFNLFYSSGLETRAAKAISAVNEGALDMPTELEIFYNLMLDEYFNEWIYLATECADSPRDSVEDYRASVQSMGEPWQSFFTGLDQYQSCAQIPHRPLAEQAKAISQPTLVVAGQDDPVTVSNSVGALRTWLDDGVFWFREDLAHAEALTDPCAVKVFKGFLQGKFTNASQIKHIDGC